MTNETEYSRELVFEVNRKPPYKFGESPDMKCVKDYDEAESLGTGIPTRSIEGSLSLFLDHTRLGTGKWEIIFRKVKD